ncbi:glycine betaine ABC transporter substrate-binding protein [Alkalicoccobacillus murimartini]|uniref:Glycine betaine/proline transport system substrate-binding protein n=1 Tax=Alkalicoccobacillus murimartini TaxID=171685 RepID=A0ABT9YLD3_9BACI|nr:glycine betaine ABC transporter substrate-binding protein [Alkalicoccobacillus murimartini]MDQ0208684.1 glycine betaine/proline transport system substrate-binding protein [Alkalicoccobacillus murimartini]
MLTRKNVLSGILLTTAISLTACGGDSTGDGGSITIGHTTYSDGTAFAYVWKQLLEEQGYDVDITTFEKAFLFEGTTNGDLDISFPAWLPFTDQSYVSLDTDDLEISEEGIMYKGAHNGLVVPTYMEDINSISDLNDHIDEFDATIAGIDPGSSLMQIMHEEIIPHYNLEAFELTNSSEQAMMQQLDTAYQNQDPVVVTLWSPHYAFEDYDLKYLEDPDQAFGEPDDIYYMGRNGFTEDFPEVDSWLKNSFFEEEQLSELLSLRQQLGDDEEAASQWIEENRDVTDSWLD